MPRGGFQGHPGMPASGLPAQAPPQPQESTLFGNSLEQLNAKRGEDDLAEFIGEFIFPIVLTQVNNEDLSSAITGMLIDQEPPKLAEMLSSQQSLNALIAEAKSTLAKAP